MFDVYMHAHAIDPRARRKMTLLVALAAMATTASLATALVGERLGISRVGAPKLDSLLVLPEDELPAALASPPPLGGPPPAASDELVDPETPPDPAPRIRASEVHAPLERSPAHGSAGAANGLAGPPPIGALATPGLPCAVPGTCAKIPPSRPTPTAAQPKPAFEPIDVARARAIATPDPPRELLARTPAGLAGRSGRTNVTFCISTTGTTTAVRTRSSSGDREVDRICRDTVARWRFRPLRVDDDPRVTCSEVQFQIAFE